MIFRDGSPEIQEFLELRQKGIAVGEPLGRHSSLLVVVSQLPLGRVDVELAASQKPQYEEVICLLNKRNISVLSLK